MPTILLVDDDPLDASIRKATLETKFHNVQRAADPIEAFGIVEQLHFAGRLALVIADLHRPGLDGQEILAEMHARLPGVPMLIFGGPDGSPDGSSESSIRFLSRHAAPEEMLIAASEMIARKPLSPRIQ